MAAAQESGYKPSSMPEAMQEVTLYQFELCPFCHKVKAGLEIKGLPFQKVDVNPMTRAELPALPEGSTKKVPVIQAVGQTVQDSTRILDYLEQQALGHGSWIPATEEAAKKAREIETWVDEDLSQVLPPVIYGRWSDAMRAARVIAKTSNFGPVQNAVVRGGGSLIMHQVAKKIMKRRGGNDPLAMLDAEMDKFEGWLGDQAFVCGDELSLGDVAVHGCLSCIADFPAFAHIMKRPHIAAWFARVQDIRDRNRAQA